MTLLSLKTLCRSLFCVVILSVITGCSLTQIGQQTARLENLSTLQGHVTVKTDESGPVHVLLFRHTGMGLEVLSRQALSSNGSYLFYVDAGVYTVGAFVDANEDGEYIGDEPATYTGEALGKPALLEVTSGGTHAVDELVIERALNRHPPIPVSVESTISQANVGRIVDLSDDRFSTGYSSMGLWRPVNFLDTIGAGLFMLGEYDKDKTPVVFVHGISGSPANFSQVIPQLDLQKFQPWVLHYPSGLSLDIVSDYMLRALGELQAEHQFSEIYVVAHSMGGLMVRSFVLRHEETQNDFKLGLLVTINSPLYGMNSAAAGVKTAPVVLPVWRDVASNSAYVQRVHATSLPAQLPYHLVFSYQEGEDGDGVVPLNSQLSRSLQQEAQAIYGFDANHSGILKDPEFILQLNQILAAP